MLGTPSAQGERVAEHGVVAMKQSLIVKTLGLVTVLGGLAQPSLAAAQHRGRGGAINARNAESGAPLQLRDTGSLSEGDRTDREGRHLTARSLPLRAGDRVTFIVRSESFDVMARVRGPGNQQWEDDDGAGNTDARLVFTAPRDAAYQFIVTSYEAGATGEFSTEISVRRGGAPGLDVDPSGDPSGEDEAGDCPNDDGDEGRDDGDEGRGEDRADEDRADEDGGDDDADRTAPAADAAPSAGGQTYGIFVGISHYGGDNHDLPGAASDAVQLARAFQTARWMPRQNAIVLTDAQATAQNVRQAFATMSQRVGPQDTLVFFFDGHGGSSVLDTVGHDVSRRELSQMMSRVRGRQLLVLDSCEAGGFAPLVQQNAQRAGLFSSRADQESSTAPEVNAGGWLAYFFRRAVEGEVRRGADGALDFQAVRRYVAEQYNRRGVSRSQELVAVASNPRFSIGGTQDAVAPPSDVMVARRDGRRPNTGRRVPVLAPRDTAPSEREPLFGSNDQFSQILQMATTQFGPQLSQFVK